MLRGSRGATESEKTHRSPRWWRYLSYALLGLTIVVTVAFFLSFWLGSAKIDGHKSIGRAFLMAAVSVPTFYASLILAVINFLTALTGTLVRQRSRMVWMATALALMPIGYLTVLDYM